MPKGYRGESNGDVIRSSFANFPPARRHWPPVKPFLLMIGVLLSLPWLAACSPAAPTSTPTLDLNPFRTEVASTVLAQVTRDLALTPTITPFPSPTATNPPTFTPSPTASQSPDGTITVTVTSGTPTAATEDKAQWVGQSVTDDTVFAPGQAFTMTWTLKNTGTSTWTAGYLLRYFSGDLFGAPREIAIGREVPPDGEIDISIQMKAPAKPGDFQTNWVMSTENRNNFKEPVFLKIKVVIPPTPTPTLKP